MLLLERPPKPPSFDRVTQESRQQVEESRHDEKRPSFPDAWKDFKPTFAEVQRGRCGYCEALVTDTGQLDHYRPKGAVSELGADPATWGEVSPDGRVLGRDTPPVSKTGYWWLAYEWSNYVFSCERCNVGWKRQLFPVAESPRLEIVPSVENRETPLLLNPYGSENPAKHLLFDWWGRIKPVERSDVGYETIRTLGLDRERLTGKREDFAQTAYQAVEEYLTAANKAIEAQGDGDTEAVRRAMEEEQGALEDIHRRGQLDKEHAGMARIIFEVEVGRPWSWLEEQVAVQAAPESEE